MLRPRRRPQDAPPPARQPGRNLPPALLAGHDLLGLELREDTPPGTEVHRLRAEDPEGRPVSKHVERSARQCEAALPAWPTLAIAKVPVLTAGIVVLHLPNQTTFAVNLSPFWT